MNRRSQHELFVSERPVRSEYGAERSYARRRLTTVIVLALALGGAGYAFWGRGAPNPADIPTIKTEGSYKQKPADPGGIDIPHQDVRVYDQLESKNGTAPQIEHLLPPPETPKETPKETTPAAAPPAPLPTANIAPATAPVPTSAPVAAVSATPSNVGILPGESAPKPVDTTVAPVPASVPVPSPPVAAVPAPALPPQPPAAAPKAATLSIEQVIKNTTAKSPTPSATPAVASAPPPKASPAAGSAAIQLASLPNEAQARAMMEKLQQKYAAKLGSAKLRVVRADLGSRGIYYRIQSQSLAEGEANRVCSSLKQINAGCILVAK